jgi:hypothetical protein
VKREVLAGCVAALALSACSSDSFVRMTDAMLFPNVEPAFEVNAVRPIWNCDKSPDPRYPCVGIGPEGFVRDLVARPFANKHVMQIRDLDRKATYRIRFTWFSMTGSCAGFSPIQGGLWIEQRQEFLIPITLVRGRTFADYAKPVGDRIRADPTNTGPGVESGLTRLSAEKIFEAEKATGKKMTPRRKSDGSLVTEPFFPPNTQCDADYMDQSAGKPFSVGLCVYARDPPENQWPWIFGDAWVKPSKRGQFRSGCREEQRNGKTWSVCLGAGTELPGGTKGTREVQRERWVARLSDSGFVMIVWGAYEEPLFLFPKWYAERQASLLEVIDSVRVERTELP